MDSGLSLDASSGVFGRGDLSLAVGGGNVRRTGRCVYSSSFRRCWLLDTC